jgi:hypothetical protein
MAAYILKRQFREIEPKQFTPQILLLPEFDHMADNTEYQHGIKKRSLEEQDNCYYGP